MDVESSSPSSPYSPPSLRHKLRTTVCGCFGSPGGGGGSGERRAAEGAGRARWRRRVAAGEFRYDPLSYALNFDEGGDLYDEGRDAAAFRYKDFASRLPPSPAPARRPAAVAIA